MKSIISFFILILSLSATAQNTTLTFNATDKTLTNIPDKVDLVAGIPMKITGCSDKTIFVIKLKEGSTTKVPVINIKCDTTPVLKSESQPTKEWKGFILMGDKELFTFLLSKEGKIHDAKATNATTETGTTVDSSPVKPSDIQFVDPAYLMSVNSGQQGIPDNRLQYNPCLNSWDLVIGKDTSRALDYLRTKNGGLSFIISPVNTLRYDITVGKTFVFTETEIPALFTQLYDQLGSFPGLSDSDGTAREKMKPELEKLLKLNTDLKQFLSAKANSIDCGSMASFETQKSAIIDVIKKKENFNGIDVAKKYKEVKKAYLKEFQTDFKGDEAKYNQHAKDFFKLEVTPDALVTETVKLVNTLIQTSFRYQYNVPQIKNAEELVFDLTLKPKEGSNGGIYMDKEQFRLPIYNNWSIEASTGFYYTDATNAQFSLRNNHEVIPGNTQDTDPTNDNDVINLDSLVSKSIVQDRGTAAGTIGAAAFVHPAYKVAPGVKLMLSLGAGSSTDLNYSFLLGGGLMLGKKNRIAISGGWSWNSVKELSSQYIDDPIAGLPEERYFTQNREVVDLQMNNTIKQRAFFSITYSFGFKKPQQAAAAATPAEEKPKEEEKEKNEDK
jgi:hypothetical protein